MADDSNLRAQINALAEQAVRESQPVPGDAPAPSGKFTFGGREFASQQEAEMSVYQAIKEREDKLLAQNAEAEALRKQQANAPAPTQFETGKAPEFNNEKYLQLHIQNPMEAERYKLRAALFGDPDAKGDPFVMLQNVAMLAMQNNQRMEDIQLRQDHPEVPWGQEGILKLIEDKRTALGLAPNMAGRHMAIRELQGNGDLPTMRDFNQYRQQQATQRPAPQQHSVTADQMWSTAAPTVPGIPSGGGSATPNVGLEEQAAVMSRMTLAQQRDYLQKLRETAQGIQ